MFQSRDTDPSTTNILTLGVEVTKSLKSVPYSLTLITPKPNFNVLAGFIAETHNVTFGYIITKYGLKLKVHISFTFLHCTYSLEHDISIEF